MSDSKDREDMESTFNYLEAVGVATDEQLQELPANEDEVQQRIREQYQERLKLAYRTGYEDATGGVTPDDGQVQSGLNSVMSQLRQRNPFLESSTDSEDEE